MIIVLKTVDALTVRKKVIATESGGNKNKKIKEKERNRAESTRLTQPTSQPIIPTLSSSLGLIYSLSPLVSQPTSSSVATSAHLLPPNSNSAATSALSPSLKQCRHFSARPPPSLRQPLRVVEHDSEWRRESRTGCGGGVIGVYFSSISSPHSLSYCFLAR